MQLAIFKIASSLLKKKIFHLSAFLGFEKSKGRGRGKMGGKLYTFGGVKYLILLLLIFLFKREDNYVLMWIFLLERNEDLFIYFSTEYTFL